MTERGLPSADGSPACPFVAFEDDRDERSASPDHRHRCYAEDPPAPRAAAHQEAYCLSSAFPVCPVFQDWARREAAHARMAPPAPAAEPVEPSAPAGAESRPDAAEPPDVIPEETEPSPRRNPPRDWAAPPPWAASSAAAGAAAASGASGASDASAKPRPPREGQGLAGSAADRIATGGPVVVPPSTPQTGSTAGSGAVGPSVRAAAADPDLAGLVGAPPARPAGAGSPPPRPGKRPTVSSTRGSAAPRDAGRDRAAAAGHEGPAWEQARRYEAYPTIKTRSGLPGLPNLPRIALLAGALGIAAVALFFLPALFGVGSDDANPTPTPSREAIATPTPDPTPEPAPTPRTYTIKSGDTLLKISRRFDITLDELLEANEDTIKDPDRISVGDEIIIPVATPAEAAPTEGAPATEEAAPTEES